tara:strand:+ start:1153 stop:2169 length:1017 start_codon:yes stop_codon:yes gene_type:complete
MQHHPTRPPSSGPAHVKCGGYASTGEDSPATIKGTRIHNNLEQLLTGQPVNPPVLADELPGVEWAHKYVLDNFNIEALRCEDMVHVYDEYGEPITFGTNDLYDGEQLGDFKTGQVREYRAQMAYYAAGRMQQTGTEEIKVHEIYTEKRWANVYILTYSEAWEIVDQITYNKKNNILKPNDYCSWCKHNSHCPALTKIAMNALEKISPETELQNYDFTQLKTPEDKGKAYQLCKVLEDWISGVKKVVSDSVLKNGEDVPGIKITTRSGGSEVQDIPAAFARMELSQEEFLKACSVSIPKLTKTYQKKFNLTGKEASREVANRLECLIKNKPDTRYIRRK